MDDNLIYTLSDDNKITPYIDNIIGWKVWTQLVWNQPIKIQLNELKFWANEWDLTCL